LFISVIIITSTK